MKIRYFQDTDTLYIELRPALVTETRDLDEDTVIDLDERGTICAITIEHASERMQSVKCVPSMEFDDRCTNIPGRTCAGLSRSGRGERRARKRPWRPVSLDGRSMSAGNAQFHSLSHFAVRNGPSMARCH